MTRFVVDASVAVKWFLDENESAEARLLLARDYRLTAPDLVFAEAANILWKRVRRKEMTPTQAQSVQLGLFDIPIDVFEIAALTSDALRLAAETNATVYDCMYLALALRNGFLLVTADQRLCRRLADGPYGAPVVPLAEFRPPGLH